MRSVDQRGSCAVLEKFMTSCRISLPRRFSSWGVRLFRSRESAQVESTTGGFTSGSGAGSTGRVVGWTGGDSRDGLGETSATFLASSGRFAADFDFIFGEFAASAFF